MTSSWITSILETSMKFFGDKIAIIFNLLTIDPTTYMNGAIWNVVNKIFDALLVSGYSLMAICLYVEIIRGSKDLIVFRRPENVIWIFIACSVLGAVMKSAKYILLMIVEIGQELVGSVIGVTGGNAANAFSWTVPDSIKNATNDMSTTMGVLMWLVCLLGALVIVVSSFTILLTGYGRIFNLYLHIAIAPIPIAFASSQATRQYFMNFLKSFIGLCIQALLIVIACSVFAAFSDGFESAGGLSGTADSYVSGTADGNPSAGEIAEGAMDAIHGDDEPEKIVWSYLLEELFLFVLLAGTIKGSDQIVNKMFGM